MIACRAGGGNREAVLFQLVGNADLTEGWLLDRERAMASSIACSMRSSTPAAGSIRRRLS
jgi:hypothetical protein